MNENSCLGIIAVLKLAMNLMSVSLSFNFLVILGHVVAHGRLVRVERLPCCGIGLGWLL